MNKNYEYPIELDWTREEMLVVIKLLQLVEDAYETSVRTEVFRQAYQEYKQHFKAIADEKKLDRNFKQVSGYSLYQVIKKVKETSKATVKM